MLAQDEPRPYVQDLRIAPADTTPGMRFTEIADIITTPKGLILTAHSTEGVIRVFDSNGQLLRNFGKKGSGPGEFMANIRFGGISGDTIAVIDHDHNVVTWFGIDGSVREVVQASGHWADRTISAPLKVDRSMVRMAFLSTAQFSKTDSTTYWIEDRDGRMVTKVAHDSVPYFFLKNEPLVSGIIGYSLVRQPFVPTILYAMDHTGTGAVIALPHTQWNGKPGQLKLLMVNHDGVVSERILSTEARKITPADVDAWIRNRTANRTNPAELEKLLRDSLIVSEYFPAAETLMVGRDGSIWIRPGGPVTDWTVFAPRRHPHLHGPRAARRALPVRTSPWTTSGPSALDGAGHQVAVRYHFTRP